MATCVRMSPPVLAVLISVTYARAHTLLQRLHGGSGLQWNQALSLEVEDMLLLKLLHLDELLLEGQLLTAQLLQRTEGFRVER